MNLPVLSETTKSQLLALRESSQPQFFALVKALREAGWPLRAIAEALSVSRAAVARWDEKYDPSIPLPVVEAVPQTPVKERKSRPRKSLSEDQKTELLSLTKEASTVRRYTDLNASSRQAAKSLETLLYTYSVSGISYAQLAEACGVSRSAIVQRLRKLK